MLKQYYMWLLLLMLSGLAMADNETMKQRLQLIMPGAIIGSVEPLADTGLYETVVNGEIIYFSADAQYAFRGDVIDLATRTNVTENRRISVRQTILSSLDEQDLIIYEPKEEVAYVVTVFTDIDCGYCRKLHRQMADYNDLGIRIRYMAFPRAGIDSASFNIAKNVWCAKDRRKAMTDAKNGIAVGSVDCDTPVRAHYEMGRQLGITSTPTLFLQSGQMLPGYIPPARLKQLLDGHG